MSNGSEQIDDEAILIAQMNGVNEAVHKARLLMIPTEDVECIDCGDDISPERKKAVPSAVRCVFCEDKKERFKR